MVQAEQSEPLVIVIIQSAILFGFHLVRYIDMIELIKNNKNIII